MATRPHVACDYALDGTVKRQNDHAVSRVAETGKGTLKSSYAMEVHEAEKRR